MPTHNSAAAAAGDVYHHNNYPPFSFVHVFRIITMAFWIQITLFML